MTHERLEFHICEWLTRAREAKGLSQEALAAQLGHSQSYVAKLESGKLRVSLIAFMAFISALDVPEGEVLALIRDLRTLMTSTSLWEGQERN